MNESVQIKGLIGAHGNLYLLLNSKIIESFIFSSYPPPEKSNGMAMEKDCKAVTTLSGTEYIRALAEDGSTVRIPVAELGKVMAQVMPVATNEKNGLMSAAFAERQYAVPPNGNCILDTGIYVISASFYDRSAILMVSNLKSTYLGKDDFFDAYTTLEVVDVSKCKIINGYVGTVVYKVKRIA